MRADRRSQPDVRTLRQRFCFRTFDGKDCTSGHNDPNKARFHRSQFCVAMHVRIGASEVEVAGLGALIRRACFAAATTPAPDRLHGGIFGLEILRPARLIASEWSRSSAG